jgi:hypothetical protein
MDKKQLKEAAAAYALEQIGVKQFNENRPARLAIIEDFVAGAKWALAASTLVNSSDNFLVSKSNHFANRKRYIYWLKQGDGLKAAKYKAQADYYLAKAQEARPDYFPKYRN